MNNVSQKEFGFLKSKIFVIIGVAFAILILVASAREIIRRLQVEKEIEALQKEIELLENKNSELKGLIEYYQTESFAERQAREKLNLQKEGERAVIISENTSEKFALEKEKQIQGKSNLQKWWDYFFAPR